MGVSYTGDTVHFPMAGIFQIREASTIFLIAVDPGNNASWFCLPRSEEPEGRTLSHTIPSRNPRQPF